MHFIARQEMFFLATSDAQGDCDVSFRAGEAGFVHALGGKILVYPEYRGNGVMASLANITENPHAGLLFVDFIQDKVGLHVNGAARILSNEEVLACPDLADALRADIAAVGGRRPERWVLVTVEEAYIHCSKHIPRLEKVGEEVRQWGTDDDRAKGGDYFRAKSHPGAFSTTPLNGTESDQKYEHKGCNRCSPAWPSASEVAATHASRDRPAG